MAYCKTLNFHVPFILRISQPRQNRKNKGSRIWWAGRPAVFLQRHYPASPGVHLPSVTLRSHCRADKGTGVAALSLRIIYYDGDYTILRIRAGLDTLESRHEQLTERFFNHSVLPETSCLHYLLPDKRDISVTGRLRHARTLEPLKSRTVKFRYSFLPYCLDHYI